MKEDKSRLIYLGGNSRLNYGEVYDCSIKRPLGMRGPVMLKVETDISTVDLTYASNVDFLGDWIAERD